ncbi:diacylglycerol kinase family lipid kinase [Chlorobaculum sp. MV4-Y]|uniref:diacylglycerol/lipid kinase family protein n=1 Tax=Chlorobaculum sp. MV4-Y TaxID=2976335 RepID=UPI0021AEDF32|nr:diacylglycerol kinase family protein [Chlorobaculum sp. MV4-Y]UWX58191.1 diacylglycerol kinase family lipid kinase [Chlorobaculum sp. MV4-Y]
MNCPSANSKPGRFFTTPETAMGGSVTFIFNPAADKGRAASKADLIERSLAHFETASLETTRFAGHAGEIARAAARDGATLIACGGDGTLNEVVNAVAGQAVKIGVLPVGSANDFLKTFNPSTKEHEARIRGFAGSASRRVDLGKVEFGGGESRYFVNSIGIGFTGRIASTVKATPWLRGELSYAWALVKVLLGYSAVKMHITLDTVEGMVDLYEPVFAFSVSNGKVEGGKFRISPDADPCDGLLDVCILKAIPKWRLPGYVLKYLKGSQIYDSKVIYCKAKSVNVFLSVSEAMHMDGEVIDKAGGAIAITAEPLAVEMLYEP